VTYPPTLTVSEGGITMTASPVRVRKIEDVDRDIDQARRERSRTLIQIAQYLGTIAYLRSKYAKAGTRIDGLLEERTAMSVLHEPSSPA
jgi:hypothetical protein